jgi:hypothetical protein
MHDSMSENDSAVAARRTAAAAVLADYRAALASAPLSQPPGRDWMFKLADALAMVLGEDQADDELDEDEPYCATCGGPVGIFIGHGDGWHHYQGEGTADSPAELVDADHEPVVAWRLAGAR